MKKPPSEAFLGNKKMEKMGGGGPNKLKTKESKKETKIVSIYISFFCPRISWSTFAFMWPLCLSVLFFNWLVFQTKGFMDERKTSWSFFFGEKKDVDYNVIEERRFPAMLNVAYHVSYFLLLYFHFIYMVRCWWENGSWIYMYDWGPCSFLNYLFNLPMKNPGRLHRLACSSSNTLLSGTLCL